MSEEASTTCNDILLAEEVCGMIAKNREIQFKLEGLGMTRQDAVKHFADRKALLRVRNILIDEGERIASLLP